MCNVSPMSNTAELPLITVQLPSFLRFLVTHTWASLQTPLSCIPPLSFSSAPPPVLPPLISLPLHTPISHFSSQLLLTCLLSPLFSLYSPLFLSSPAVLKHPPFHFIFSSLPLYLDVVFGSGECAFGSFSLWNISFTSSTLPHPSVLPPTYLMWWEVK